MPVSTLTITVTVKAVRPSGDVKQMETSYVVPKNDVLGFALADAGKIRLGALAEEMGDLLDKDGSPL